MLNGNRIKQIRDLKKLELKELAELVDITSAYLSQIENGKRLNPSAKILNKIAEALEVSVDEFFKEDSDITEVKDKSEKQESRTLAFHRKDGYEDDLPDEARKEIENFIEFVKQKYKKKD